MELIVFTASWCVPCKAMKEELKDFSLVPVKIIDIEEETELAEKYRISSVPTLMLMEGDKVVWRSAGSRSREELESQVKKQAISPYPDDEFSI